MNSHLEWFKGVRNLNVGRRHSHAGLAEPFIGHLLLLQHGNLTGLIRLLHHGINFLQESLA